MERRSPGTLTGCVPGRWLGQQAADGLGDRLGLLRQAPVCDPHDAVAGNLKRGIARPIALEGKTRAVILVAVKLDHEPAIIPHGIDLESRYEGVDVRGGRASSRQRARKRRSNSERV
jgi:hypothetical protein